MKNIQCITDTSGCNKYCIKYIGKIDNQNYVIVYSDGNTNGKLITKAQFLNNTKLSASKYNEDKKLNAKQENSRSRVLSVAEIEMLHNMLLHSEVSTYLASVDISNTHLYMHPSVKAGIINYRYTSSNDNGDTSKEKIEYVSEVANTCNYARKIQQLENFCLLLTTIF